MPLLVTAIVPQARLIPFVSVSSLVVLQLWVDWLHMPVGKSDHGCYSCDVLGGLAMAMTAGMGG